MEKTLTSSAHRALIDAMVAARKNSGMTQTELAQLLKCQQSLIARIESGQRRVDAVDLVRWAEAVGVDPAEFLSVVADALSERGHFA